MADLGPQAMDGSWPGIRVIDPEAKALFDEIVSEEGFWKQ
jgi:hypothetical protein